MKEIKKLAIVLGCAVFFIVFYILCANSAQSAKAYYAQYNGDSDIKTKPYTSVEDAVRKYAAVNIEKEITITGVGDIMFYDYQMDRAYDSTKGTFDFSPSFTAIAPYLAQSDYVLGNLEGTAAGKDKGTSSNSYGYWADVNQMNFNIPEQALADLKTAGLDMVTTANNHLLDSGSEGVGATIDHIAQAGLDQTGSFKNKTDQKYTIKNINGVNVGVIAYTGFLNAAPQDGDQYDVNSLDGQADLDNYDASKVTLMCSQIQEMRSKGADVVVVNLHFGTKYASEPGENQKALVKKLVESGADIIFGSYPHVVQPMEVIETVMADGTSHTGVVFYSLGNFISSMQYQSNNGYPRDLGIIASVTLTVTSRGTQLEYAQVIPTFVDWTDQDIAVLPLCQAHDHPETFKDRLEYYDLERINAGYGDKGVIQTVIGNSGLNYTYSDYKYKIMLEKQLTN